MRCVGYTSKLYSLAMLAAVVAFGLFFALAGDKLPKVLHIGVPVMAGLMAIGCIVGMCRSKPLIEADEEGLYWRNLWMRKIPWDRIVSAERLPLVQKFRRGFGVSTGFDLREGWRQILISVRDPEDLMSGVGKASFRIAQSQPAKGRSIHYLPDEKNPGCYILVIQTIGTTADSGELFACIEYYLAQQKS